MWFIARRWRQMEALRLAARGCSGTIQQTSCAYKKSWGWRWQAGAGAGRDDRGTMAWLLHAAARRYRGWSPIRTSRKNCRVSSDEGQRRLLRIDHRHFLGVFRLLNNVRRCSSQNQRVLWAAIWRNSRSNPLGFKITRTASKAQSRSWVHWKSEDSRRMCDVRRFQDHDRILDSIWWEWKKLYGSTH